MTSDLIRCLSVIPFILIGCGPAPERLVGVSRIVIVDGNPLGSAKTQMVAFIPENEKQEHDPPAVIGRDGHYTLETLGRAGAPLGKSKVLVWITDDNAAKANPWGPDGTLRKLEYLIDPKYPSRETTDLIIEVTDNPTAEQYDLKLSR